MQSHVCRSEERSSKDRTAMNSSPPSKKRASHPDGTGVKNLSANAGDTRDPPGSVPESRRSLRRKWQPAPVFLPGKSYGQRSLLGYTVHGLTKQLDTSEHTRTHSTDSASVSTKQRRTGKHTLNHSPAWSWGLLSLCGGLLQAPPFRQDSSGSRPTSILNLENVKVSFPQPSALLF